MRQKVKFNQFNIAGILSNLYCRVITNSVATASTFTNRKNAAAGSQSISVGVNATGEFEDAVNTDTVAIDAISSVEVRTIHTMSDNSNLCSCCRSKLRSKPRMMEFKISSGIECQR